MNRLRCVLPGFTPKAAGLLPRLRHLHPFVRGPSASLIIAQRGIRRVAFCAAILIARRLLQLNHSHSLHPRCVTQSGVECRQRRAEVLDARECSASAAASLVEKSRTTRSANN